ncbi:MAG: hypothetical protein ACXAE3_11150, partial [Candidatus Kariarchaeaceae archaeon]
MATSSLNLIASTFIILYVIDLVDFAGLSIVISISFVVSALTDYPTGVLADWLGHKWVLAVGYGFYAIASILLVFAPAASNPLRYLGFTYVVLALASGQASGALESWFDNSYKDATTLEDPKKEIYREYLGKATMLIQYSGSLAFLFGGILASLLGDSGR